MFHSGLDRALRGVLLGLLSWFAVLGATAPAGEILVSDRINNSVYRYSPDGSFLGILLTDHVNLNWPNGIQVSPDQTKLYVASGQNNLVVRYDYDYAAGTATNPWVLATAAEGLAFPNSIIFSPSGDRIFVSNLGGTGVTQLNLDGSVAGPPINGLVGGGSVFQFSGLAYAPGGELLVGGFQDFPAGTSGAVARSDVGHTTLSDFIGPANNLSGTGNLLVLGNDLYVTAGNTGRVDRYNATTGALDGTFTPITGLGFPISILAAPDGNGILIGDLGLVDGTGAILRYDFDGTFLSEFALVQANPLDGFQEATGMLYVVPEPATGGLLIAAVAWLPLLWRRRRARV